MALENISSISLTGKLTSYHGDEAFRATPIEIKELLSGKTSFIEEASYEELYLKSIEFEVSIHDGNYDEIDEIDEIEDTEVIEKAGTLVGRLFDIERCEEDEFEPLEVFDAVDQYTYEIYEMGRMHHEGILSENIFAIDSFMIYPEYRGKNIGTAAIHMLAEVIEAQFNMNVGCFIVLPEPRYDAERESKPDEAQYKHYKARCEEFWKRMGFASLPDSPYWYFNVDMKMLVNGENRIEEKEAESPSYEPVAESAIIYKFPSYNETDK